MATTITIEDQSTTGKKLHEFTLDFLTTEVSVRELIRERVHQEVKDHNAKKGEFRGLVMPSDEELARNGKAAKKPRTIDWKVQFERAVEAFEHGRVLILVDQTQVDDLEQRVTLTPSTRVAFLKLTPLVGG